VVGEIRIYVEGGGDGKETRAAIRRGLGKFLEPLRQLARRRRIRWTTIACGGRHSAYSLFVQALKDHPDAFNVLLVDSEAPVTTSARDHLARSEGWDPDTEDACLQLMAQTMEAWFVADVETLARFYGAGFRKNAIPKTQDVEQIDKARLERALNRASAETRKGRYHKIRHGGPLLGLLDASRVRARARHCDRLFVTLESRIG
jgi:Domain of unknown function (DUF4276)